MTEEKKDEVMDRKQEMVKAGRIEDPRIFRLLYLGQVVVAEEFRAQLKERTIQDQMAQLKADRQASRQQSEQKVQSCADQAAFIRKSLSEEYQIDLELWGYDDITGVAAPLPPDAQKQILDRRAKQKALVEERAAAKQEESAADDVEGSNVTDEKAVGNKKKARKKRKNDEASTDTVEA